MKFLIIRFSSIGDVAQSLSIPYVIKKKYPLAEVHFLTRNDFKDLFLNNESIDQLWTIDRKMGALKLIQFYRELNQQNYTHLFDAHNNLRSLLARMFISAEHKLVRSLERLNRILLIRFKINRFEKPFSGQRDLLQPLKKWDIPFDFPNSIPTENLFNFSTEELHHFKKKWILPKNFITLVPSAAYELKRWPMKNWHEYIQKNPQQKFVILAGPADRFTQDLEIHPNVTNWTGKTTLRESAYIISQSFATIANDTGLMHISEQMGKATIALMGPAPFGFPSRKTTLILEKNLSCRPCSKHGQGPCVNAIFHECLASISAEQVSSAIQRLDQLS